MSMGNIDIDLLYLTIMLWNYSKYCYSHINAIDSKFVTVQQANKGRAVTVTTYVFTIPV